MFACSRLHLKLDSHKEYKYKTSKAKKKTQKNIQKKQKQKNCSFTSLVVASLCFKKSNFFTWIFVDVGVILFNLLPHYPVFAFLVFY